MALTKKMLQAMDIADDKIEQILEAHNESITGLTKVRDDLKTQVDDLTEKVGELDSTKKELVKVQAKLEDAEKKSEKLDELQAEYDSFKKDVEGKEKLASKEKAYRELLKQAGVSDKRFDAIVKVTDLEGIEMDAEGKIKDSDKVVEGIKSEWSDFIVTEGKKGAETSKPPTGGEGAGSFEKMSLAEKMAYANENPDNSEVRAWLES